MDWEDTVTQSRPINLTYIRQYVLWNTKKETWINTSARTLSNIFTLIYKQKFIRETYTD